MMCATQRGGRARWHGVVMWLGVGLCGCTADGGGTCGPVLSVAECEIVRVQLGVLPPLPPPDPTNRVARGGQGPEGMDEERAVELGQRLFFDRCLSSDRQTSCATCHDPAAAFIDARARELLRPVTIVQNGVSTTVLLPPIVQPTPERVTQPPPAVAPERDPNGDPLAFWDAAAGRWRGVVRRPQASRGAEGRGFTARNSPTLYNLAYGAAVPPLDGARTAGTTWVPWDGRYDSIWALAAEVFEFGATHRTNRAHLAQRIFRKHRSLYEAAFRVALPDLDARIGLPDSKMKYPRHASPVTTFNPAWVDCWHGRGAGCPPDPDTGLPVLPPTDEVKAELNTIQANAGKALAAYMRRLRAGRSPYDRWMAGDHGAMSLAAQRGLRLFIGKAACILCHGGPNFTDWRFHNLGVPAFDPERRTAGSDYLPGRPQAGAGRLDCHFPGAPPGTGCPDAGRWAWQNRLAGRCEPERDEGGRLVRNEHGEPVFRACQRSDGLSCFASLSPDGSQPASDDPRSCLPEQLFDRCQHRDGATCSRRPLCRWHEEIGLCTPRADEADLGAFKTPSLRNVARTWPYMHNGALYDYGPAERGQVSPDDPTPHLMKVIEFYNQGGGEPVVGRRDPLLRPLHLSRAEMSDLVEFLKALSDDDAGDGALSRMPADLADVSDCPK
ncbi:MAG: hypothetical protein NZ890_11570 [Myxococcota bacterium]|nr:hypothetical protein [Myxococcota bacterium]